MSARHTRDPEIDGGLMDGMALVPSMGWVGSVMPAGRHRSVMHERLLYPGERELVLLFGRWYRSGNWPGIIGKQRYLT